MMKPNINGNLYGHTSMVAVINEIQMFLTGIKEINYTQKMDPGKAYGTSPYMLGRTSGQIEATGSMTLLKQEFDQLIGHPAFGNGYMQKSWNMQVSWQEEGLEIVTDELVGIRITSVDVQSSSGNEPIHVKCELSIMYIQHGVKNGESVASAVMGFTWVF